MPCTSWDELELSTRALREASHRLCDDLTPDMLERFLSSGQLMVRRAELFADLVLQRQLDLNDSKVRHDLRGHLGAIINYGDLWLRRGKQLGLSRTPESLRELVAAARQTLSVLDGAKPSAANTLIRSAAPLLPSWSPPTPERGRLLVVDDNPENREHLQEMLEQLGHTVRVAERGQDALNLVQTEQFDLVLLDVMMPEMDGFAVLEHLKAHDTLRHIPVLMVSALDRIDSVITCIARGAEDYLIRPLNEMLLQARLNACLEKKQLRDREIQHLQQIDRLLNAIFPPEVVEELKRDGVIQPRRHDKVGVCFIDVVGFTSYCDQHAAQPEKIVGQLEWYVDRFEKVAHKHRVQKIKTIGDAFLMVSGLLRPVNNPVLQLLRCAVDLLEDIRNGPANWQVRVGIHVGPVVAGTLGEYQYSFDLWGSTVNIAARMQSLSRPGAITLSEAAWEAIRPWCRGWPRDAAVRGIGAMTVWEFDDFIESPPER